jgi:beta-1,4-mannosyl-glycoprotein beta-1,4-N-acetylglucosaminyltransferase
MKIFDCFMYFDEDEVLDVRLNFLDKYVDYFVIVESGYNHKGEKRDPQFDLSKFKKFKDKIIYILKNEIPEGIEKIKDDDNENEQYRKSIYNAWKRENLQRNRILEGLTDANPNDWIIISDLDEIPNLEKINFNNINQKLIFFNQLMMYYKFNLKLDNFIWIGSRACKFKDLVSPQWLRDIKSKKFYWWRVDILFSKKKYNNIKFVDDGGWHFSYLKTPDKIEKKLKSYLHHIDYDRNPLGVNKITKIIKDKKTIYNLKVDQKENKFDAKNDLVKIDINKLPKYIIDNLDKFESWIEK